MKVLLDECLPIDFRHHLPGHEVHTAEWAGLKGLKNGQLLDRAEQPGYQTLITVDQGVSHQQNLGRRRISILVIRPRADSDPWRSAFRTGVDHDSEVMPISIPN